MTETPNCRNCGAVEAETQAEPVCFGSYLRGRKARQGLCPKTFNLPAYLRGRNETSARLRAERRERMWWKAS
ncbi:MAG: hypothetical protein GX573_23745 [Chloroflexi bacterium]|nr:hypothetical protein [Chloroflexota bacterium]